jgi:hypothetical protein
MTTARVTILRAIFYRMIKVAFDKIFQNNKERMKSFIVIKLHTSGMRSKYINCLI